MEPVTYRFRIALVVCLACASSNAWAQNAGQEREINRWQAGAGFLGANAVGEFDTFVPDSAPGMFGHVNRSLGRSVFSLGAEVSWNQYGSESRSLALGPLVPEVPGAAVEVHTYNAMVGLHGRLRAQLPSHRFQP